MSAPLLRIDNLSSGYADFQALFDVTFDLQAGEALALIGANGAGKSTLLKTIVGLLPCAPGMVAHRGDKIGGLSADKIVRRGIALVPEGRRLFRSLSVEENLIIGGERGRAGEWSLARVYALFPILREKRGQPATSLSGGQQQMVAIGRALMANPEIILFDEISLGLAPAIIKDIYAALPSITRTGVSAILVEQDVTRALGLAHILVCLEV
jgi:branched-chain amino acid transport system ATP-binding protein